MPLIFDLYLSEISLFLFLNPVCDNSDDRFLLSHRACSTHHFPDEAWLDNSPLWFNNGCPPDTYNYVDGGYSRAKGYLSYTYYSKCKEGYFLSL